MTETTTRVVNRHHLANDDRLRARIRGPLTYVGRGSPWGNPFSVRDHGPAAMRLFLDWLRDEPEGQHVVERAPQLRGHTLECYCTSWPAESWRPCHAVALALLADGHPLEDVRAYLLKRMGPEQATLF